MEERPWQECRSQCLEQASACACGEHDDVGVDDALEVSLNGVDLNANVDARRTGLGNGSVTLDLLVEALYLTIIICSRNFGHRSLTLNH